MPLPPIPADAVWVPHDLLDEVTPPGRPSPDAWIIARPDGSWWLSSGLDNDDTHATPLAEGQIVEFAALVDLPGVDLKIGPRIRYFRSRSRANLVEAKRAERIFDNAARALLSDPELSRLAGKPERHDV